MSFGTAFTLAFAIIISLKINRLLKKRFPDWDRLHLESRIHREAFFNGLRFRGSKGGMPPFSTNG
jgi:hypothetical protein